jgi:WD40 repeat protein
LRFHDRPVLAVAVAGVRVAGGGVAVVAATGATDGALAIWDVTRATEERESSDAETSRNQQPPGLRALAPAHVTRGAHQSGVNGIAVRAVAGAAGWFVAASGGDDQVARAEVFSFEREGRVVSVARVAVAFAHGSAIKGVWLGPGTVPGTLTLATTSHDQRVRVWTVATERTGDSTNAVAMTPAAGAFAECPEPEGLDGFVDARGRARVAVCGRGVQMFELE